MNIYKVLIVLGVILILYVPYSMTIGAHNHPPGEFIYMSKILDAEVRNDPEKAKMLEDDRRIARHRIEVIDREIVQVLMVIMASGVIVLLCGVSLRSQTKQDGIGEIHFVPSKTTHLPKQE